MKNCYYKFCSIIFVYCFFVSPVYAYLDPGTGSMVIQGLIAAIAAIGVSLKLYWHRILVFLKIRKKIIIEDDQDVDSDE